MILSDASIRKEIADGRIVIDPLDDRDVQPSSVDLRVDRYFRVFRNDTTPYIDPKQSQEDLTMLVEVEDGKAFILHPGEFVLGSTLEVVTLKIGQISFIRMTSPAERPYGSTETRSKYQGQRGPTPSRYYLNFQPDEPS